MKHTLAIESSLGQNLDTSIEDYSTKILVSQDVIDWLNNHDVEISPAGKRIYLVNHIRYVYLGPALSIVEQMEPHTKMYNIMLEKLLREESEPNIQHINRKEVTND